MSKPASTSTSDSILSGQTRSALAELSTLSPLYRQTSLTLLAQIVRAVLTAPSDAKYRRINATKLLPKLKSNAGLKLLESLGFKPEAISSSSSSAAASAVPGKGTSSVAADLYMTLVSAPDKLLSQQMTFTCEILDAILHLSSTNTSAITAVESASSSSSTSQIHFKVVSSSSTGADLAALKAAKACSLVTDGFACKDYWTGTKNDKSLKELYNLREMSQKGNYKAKESANLALSDGLVAFRVRVPKTGKGTESTVHCALTGLYEHHPLEQDQDLREYCGGQKPVLVLWDVHLDPSQVDTLGDAIAEFIIRHRCQAIMISGSTDPLYESTMYRILLRAFQQVISVTSNTITPSHDASASMATTSIAATAAFTSLSVSASSSSSSSKGDHTSSYFLAPIPPSFPFAFATPEKGDTIEDSQFVLFWRSPSFGCQWTTVPFIIEGIKYTCPEQYMMAAKARLFGDNATWTRIMTNSVPREQQKLGRQVSNFDDDVWNAHALDIVITANYAKFSQHPAFLRRLLDTGTKIIVEASPLDPLWGCGLASSHPDVRSPNKWPGTNLLGQALMHVRELLREQEGQPTATSSQKASKPAGNTAQK